MKRKKWRFKKRLNQNGPRGPYFFIAQKRVKTTNLQTHQKNPNKYLNRRFRVARYSRAKGRIMV
jgi:hypothetical protein